MSRISAQEAAAQVAGYAQACEIEERVALNASSRIVSGAVTTPIAALNAALNAATPPPDLAALSARLDALEAELVAVRGLLAQAVG